MSNSRNGQRRFLVGTMKAVVLLMCFVLIFALVLTVGVMDGGADTGANVADAAHSGGDGNQVTSYANSNTTISTLQERFHANGVGNSITLTSNLSDVTFSNSIVSYYKTGGTGEGLGFWNGGTNSSWGANSSAQHWFYEPEVIVVINVKIPDSVMAFVSAGYTVTATYSATVYTSYDNDQTNGTYMGVTSSPVAASSFLSGDSWNQSGWTTFGGGPTSGTNRTFGTNVSITSGNSNLVLGLARTSGTFQTPGIRAANHNLTFTITTNSNTVDSGAPQATIDKRGTTVTSTVAADPGSYLNSTNSALYNDIVNNAPNDRGVTINGNTISLTNAAVRYDEDGYAKRLTLNVQDYCNDGVAASASSATYYAGLAGIRANGSSSDTIGTQYGGSGSADFSYNGGTNNGRITWTVSSARDTGTLVIEFRDNTGAEGVKIQIRDSAGNTQDLTIVVGGIYGTGGSDLGGVSVYNDNTLSTAAENPFGGLVWNAENLNLNISGAGSGANSLIWYFAAERYDSAEAAFGAPSPVLSDGSLTSYYPFGYSTNDAIVNDKGDISAYDFASGLINGYGQYNNAAGATEAGYYRITLYAMNYAGYLSSSSIVIYAKMDNVEPTNNVTVTYDTLGGTAYAANDAAPLGTIAPGEEVWVGTSLTATIAFTENFSGNKVAVLGADGGMYYVYVRDGAITKITNESGAEVQGSTWTSADGGYTMTGDTFATVTVTLTGGGALQAASLAVTYTGVPDTVVEQTTNFTVYSNADIAWNASESSYAQTESNASNWSAGVRVYIDTQAPGTPDLSESGTTDTTDHVILNTNNLIPTGIYNADTRTGRFWYTAAWDMGAVLSFVGAEWDEAYYATVYYASQEEFEAGLEVFRGYYADRDFSRENGFESVYYSDIGAGTQPVSLAFDSGAGYYVTYVIGVDRAANLSALGVYGVLADANDYKIVATHAAGYIEAIDNPYTTLGFTNSDGKPTDTFKRGEIARFAPVLDESIAGAGAYVPYQIKKMNGNGDVIDTPIYSHPYTSTSGAFTSEGLLDGYAYASVSADGSTIDLAVDRTSITALPALENGATQLVFSYRRVVNAAFSGLRTDYTGEGITITPDLTYTNGGIATISDGDKPFRVVYPENFYDEQGVTHTGTYSVSILYSEAESRYYVLAAQTPDATYTVDKVALTVQASINEGDKYYGDIILGEGGNLTSFINYFIQSGLVGQDTGKAFTDLPGNGVTFSITGTGYALAGSHTVTAEFNAQDYTVTVSWEGGQSLTVLPRGFEVTAPTVEMTYGDALPSTYQVTVLKSAFEFDTLGLFDSAEEIAAVFGVDSSAVADGGSVWTVTVAASALRNNATANSFGFVNADDYDFTEFNASALNFNANFSAALASDGNGQINVSPVTVTVRPVENPAPVRVNDVDELMSVEISFRPSDNTNKFGVSGCLYINTENVSGSGNYPISADRHNLVSSHNFGEYENVLFVVEPGSDTVRVSFETASGTFTIQYNSSIGFTTQFGTFWDVTRLYYNSISANRNYTVTYVDGTGASAALPANPIFSVTVVSYDGTDENVLSNSVGSYPIDFRATGFDGTTEENYADYDFRFVDSEGNVITSLTVVPAEVTVTSAELDEGQASKVYGDLEADQLSFVFEFDGLPAGYESRFGLPEIGSIHRANADGTGAGGRYDSVGRYGVFWSGYTTDAEDSNLNITFAEGVFGSVTISITPRSIALDGSGVTISGGTNKTYDGDSTAPDASITFDNTVIINNDDVSVTFDANYWFDGREVSAFGDNYAVRFTNIKLEGADSANYELLANEIITEYIYAILQNPLIIAQSHFAVSKVYDGTTTVFKDNVTVTSATSGLYDEFLAGNFTLISGYFASANAGTAVTVTTFTLLFPTVAFPLDDDGNPVEGADLEAYFDLDGSTVERDEATGGTRVTVTGLTGSIDKRVITLGDIVFGFDTDTLTKVYDGNADVIVPFSFAQTFADSVADFDAADVALSFEATTGNKNVGEYSIDVVNVTLDGANYVLGKGLDGTDEGYTAAEGVINGDAATPYSITQRPLTFEIEFKMSQYGDGGVAAEGPSFATQPYISNIVEGESATIGNATYIYAMRNADGNGYTPFVFVQTENYENGHYYHDVLVNFEITIAGGFDWNNYSFDVTYEAGTGDGHYVVSDLFLEKAAVLDPKEIELRLSGITVNSKTYDATTAATLDFVTNDAYEDNDFIAHTADGTTVRDITSIDFDYTATFNSADVGTGKLVTISGVKIVARTTDDSGAALSEEQKQYNEYVAGSYHVSWEGAVSHSFKANINAAELNVDFTLPGKTYDGTKYGGVNESAVQAVLSGFVPAEQFSSNYRVRITAAGYTDVDVDVTDGVNAGAIYGFELYNNANGAVNYVIKPDYTEEFNVYRLTGDLASLPDTAALIVAQFEGSNGTRYLIPSSDVQDGTVPEGLTFEENRSLGVIGATGSISPAEITFEVFITDPTAFSKPFDDTTAVTGDPVYGTPDMVEGDSGDYDYYIELSSGLVGYEFVGSDFEITFSDANVGVKNVVFRVVSVGGSSQDSNYVFNAGNSFTVRGGGEITPASISANLESAAGNADIKGTYGGALEYGVSYNVNSVSVIVDAEGYGYINGIDSWNKAFGRELAPVDPAEEQLYSMNADGTFVQDAKGSYVRINGSFGTAVPVTSDGTRILNGDGVVAVAAGTYKATVSATASNFTFTESPETRTVNIAKATLRVTASSGSADGGFAADYFIGTLPVPEFAVYDETDVASFDRASALLAALRGQYSFRLDGTGDALTDTDCEISANLADGSAYLLVVDDLDNYDVVLVDANGAETKYELTVSLPAIDGGRYSPVSGGTRPYELDADGAPVTVGLDDIVGGIDDLDRVSVEWSTSDGTVLSGAPADAGTYNWTVTVTRRISADDVREYNFAGTYTVNGTYVITQRNVIVTLTGQSSYTYSGHAYYINRDEDLSATDSLTGENVEGFLQNVLVSYTFGGETVSGMLNAGAYTVVITLDSEYGDFDAANYNVVNRIPTIRVSARPVTVTVDEASTTHNVTGGADGNCEITFSAEGFPTDSFTVTYRDGRGNIVRAVTSPGVYTYTISSNDPNYTVRGNSTGRLTVVIDEVSYVSDGTTYVKISFSSPVAVNYTLSDTAMSPSSSYWGIVDRNVQSLAGEDETLTTSGILNITLGSANGNVTSLSSPVTVSALIPVGVGEGYRVYYVTPEGGLAELEDYQVSGGYITYTTDYISNLVFVNSSAPAFMWWIIPVAVAALIVLLAAAILIAVLVKLHRAPDPVPVEVAPIDSIFPEPAAPAPVMVPVPAADIEPVNYDAPAAVSKHKQPPIIGIR